MIGGNWELKIKRCKNEFRKKIFFELKNNHMDYKWYISRNRGLKKDKKFKRLKTNIIYLPIYKN